MKRNMFKTCLYSICIIVLLFFSGCGKGTAPKQTQIPERDIIPGSGNVRILPETITTQVASEFTTDIFVDSGDQKVAAYGFMLTFNKDILNVDVSEGTSGVVPGKDGYVAAQNANNPGRLEVAGFDVYGKGPGKELHFLTIHWRAMKKGKSPINLTVKNLVDETTREVGMPTGISGQVIVE